MSEQQFKIQCANGDTSEGEYRVDVPEGQKHSFFARVEGSNLVVRVFPGQEIAWHSGGYISQMGELLVATSVQKKVGTPIATQPQRAVELS